MPAFYALLTIHLHFPEAGSLKAKRKDLSSVKAQLQTRLGVSVSEVGHQDTWQRSTLAAAVATGSPGAAREAVDRVDRFLSGRFPDGVRVEHVIAGFEELA